MRQGERECLSDGWREGEGNESVSDKWRKGVNECCRREGDGGRERERKGERKEGRQVT